MKSPGPASATYSSLSPQRMRALLGIRPDRDRAGPDFLGADAGEIDRRLAVHAGRLRRVAVERAAGDHPDAVVLPSVMMIGAHVKPRPSWLRAQDIDLFGTRAMGAIGRPRTVAECKGCKGCKRERGVVGGQGARKRYLCARPLSAGFARGASPARSQPRRARCAARY